MVPMICFLWPRYSQQHIQRCEYVIRKQMDVIKQQREEIAQLVSWINGDQDARPSKFMRIDISSGEQPICL